jgi:hypothetical protein
MCYARLKKTTYKKMVDSLEVNSSKALFGSHK